MKQKRHTTEEIIRILRAVDEGKTVEAVRATFDFQRTYPHRRVAIFRDGKLKTKATKPIPTWTKPFLEGGKKNGKISLDRVNVRPPLTE